MADDESSDLSSIDSLSPPPTDDESSEVQLKKSPDGILRFFHAVPKAASRTSKEMSPPAPKREPSPPHEYVLADNPDIAFIVMFRAKFNEAFPKNLPTFGPQELEGEIVDSVPGDRVEHFLCAILKLLLNRQQDVKPGHYNRAFEDAIKNNESAWPRDWEGANPLAGGVTFATMSPVQRLGLLRTLILWTMQTCRTVKDMIDGAYKNKRQEDDLNQPLSVQPLGSDSDKRRYFLVEGVENTSFRIYRESNYAGFQRTWWSVAGTIEEIHALTDKLLTGDGGPKARKLSQKIQEQVPRFEESLEKLRKREYRMARKQQFKRPEPGFSMYEGRTRGKRAKYTYDDDDDFLTDSTNWRSNRNTRTHTPAEPTGPVVTASGRQIRAPNRLNAETVSNGGGGGSIPNSIQGDEDSEMKDDDVSIGPTGRPRRSAAVHHSLNGWSASAKRKAAKSLDDYDSDEDDEDGSEPDFGDDEDDADHAPPDESEAESDDDDDAFERDDMALDDDEDDEVTTESLVVKIPLRVTFDRGTNRWAKAAHGGGGPGEPPLASPSSSESGGRSRHHRHRDLGKAQSRSPSPPPPSTPERAAEESIAVAPFRAAAATPDPEPGRDVAAGAAPAAAKHMPTSLALRGTPEKHQHVPQAIDV